MMRVAPTVIVLVQDADGFGPAVADALRPGPNSLLTKSERSSFEFSLDKYGIKDSKSSCYLTQFLDAKGSPQVTTLLLQNYTPPVAVCLINELLTSLSSEENSTQPTIIVPLVMRTLKVYREGLNELLTDQEVRIYSAEVGGRSELTQAFIAGTVAAPPSLRIHSESLACLLQLARVFKFPTVFLFTTSDRRHSERPSNQELQALNEMGQFLASHLGLSFSKEAILQKHIEKPSALQEPWRALYG